MTQFMTQKATKVRLSLLVTAEVAQSIKDASEEAGLSRQAVLRLSLALWRMAREAKQESGYYIGFAKDPTKLDREIIGIV